MEKLGELDIMRMDLISVGFNRDFINTLNAYALCTLYELWDVEDPDEQLMNVYGFIEEYGFDERKVFQ